MTVKQQKLIEAAEFLVFLFLLIDTDILLNHHQFYSIRKRLAIVNTCEF